MLRKKRRGSRSFLEQLEPAEEGARVDVGEPNHQELNHVPADDEHPHAQIALRRIRADLAAGESLERHGTAAHETGLGNAEKGGLHGVERLGLSVLRDDAVELRARDGRNGFRRKREAERPKPRLLLRREFLLKWTPLFGP